MQASYTLLVDQKYLAPKYFRNYQNQEYTLCYFIEDDLSGAVVTMGQLIARIPK